MSNKGLRIIWGVGVLLVAMAVLGATAGCDTRGFPIGKYHPSGAPTKIMEFMADGTVVLSETYGKFPIESVRGKYRVSGNQVVFVDNYCGVSDGTYAWTFDGKALKFAVISDDCADRVSTLADVEFLKE